MRFFVSYYEAADKEKALELSNELSLELFCKEDSKSSKAFENDYFLVCSQDQLFLKKGLRKNSRPIFSDFDDWARNYDDLLLRNALKGLPKSFSCLDVTAGFGKDSLEISKLRNCESLVLLEKEKWLCKILENGMEIARSTRTKSLVNKFKIINTDNHKFLEGNKSNYDLIYIDPMFSGVSKSKAKKHMQALRDLSSELEDYKILGKCLKLAKNRIVIKRHKRMHYLESFRPTRSIEGKVIRYDIYNTN